MSSPTPDPEAEGENPSSATSLPSPESQKMDFPPAPMIIDLTLDDDDDDVLTIEARKDGALEPAIKQEPGIQTAHITTNQHQPSQSDTEASPTAAPPSPETAQQQDATINASPNEEDQVVTSQVFEAERNDPVDQMRMLQEFMKNQAQARQNGEQDYESLLSDEGGIDALDSDDEDARAATAFKNLKRRYEAKKKKGGNELEDDIEYRKAWNAEDERRRLRQSKQAYQYAEDVQDENSMFLPEKPVNQPDGDDAAGQDEVEEFQLPESQRIMLAKDVFDIEVTSEDESEPQVRQQKQPARGRKSRGTNKVKTGRGRVTKSTRGKTNAASRGRGSGRGGKKTGRRGLDMIDTNQFFRHNIIEAATANRGQAEQPGFVSKNRKDALTELIASMPESQRDLHHGDKVDLDKAVKMFRGAGSLKQTAMRSDGEGGWKLKGKTALDCYSISNNSGGMTSSLKHYQLLGAAFLRGRENSKTRPKGGLLSDDMGLGKTVMMIANIVDGRPPSDSSRADTNRATLIVVPPALTTQWMLEIDKHANRDVLRDVVVYRSGSRVMSTDPVRVLSNNDVVITSYHEVLKSMPRNEPPIYLVTAQAKQEWWDKEWTEKRGVLHRIQWHRVVLDEAQAIKNHQSKTSDAICHLQGKFRWAISGTPIQNCLEEFYSYFRFLQCDHTGSFELFKKNFCKRGSDAAIRRLQVYLAKIMCRRTHLNKLFGLPILQLPPIKPVETIEVEFDAVERAIYHIVRTRFVTKIRALGSKDTILEKNYRTVFVLLLRLRQLASSPLLIQKTLKDLLETEDLERLWQLTDDPENQTDDDGNRKTLQTLRLALGTVNSDDYSMNTARRRSSSGSNDGDILPPPKDTPGDVGDGKALSSQFRKYLQSLHDSGQWAEANDRSLCHACARPPVKPYITSCMHLYCQSCLNDLQYDAAARDEDRATCLECGKRFKKSEALAARSFEEAANRGGSPLSVRSGIRGKKKGSEDEEEDIDWFTVGGPILQSAKTKGAVKKMKEWWGADPKAKIIIFVQFRALIKIFRRICAEQGWECTYFHGAMSFEARDMAIERFTKEEDTQVMIAAMKAGGVGLNLVAANRVIIIDLWWNQSVETQAWCRVFRIGQKRDVEIARFVVKDSVDTDILQMQKRKTKEVDSAMEEQYRPARLTTKELMRLFGPIMNGDEEGQFNGEDEPFTFAEDPYEKQDEDVEMTGTVSA